MFLLSCRPPCGQTFSWGQKPVTIICPHCGRKGKLKDALFYYQMKIIIDTDEKYAWKFPAHIHTIRKKIKTADYSIEGYELELAIERKSKADMYGTLSSGIKNFLNELERFSYMKYRLIIIDDCTLAEFLEEPEHTSKPAQEVIKSLISLSVKYDVPVLFTGTRQLAAAWAIQWLERCYKEIKAREGEENK